MRPSDKQQAALVLAVADGYVNTASLTHARRCRTTCGQLSRTCQSLVRLGLMRPISLGRFQVTDAGMEHVPSSPVPQSDGETWARF